MPTVSYTTSLDRYSLIHLVFLIALLFWHAAIGSDQFFKDVDEAKRIDSYALAAFGSVLLLIQLFFATTFIRAYSEICKLKERERRQATKRSSIGNLATVL